MRHALAILLLLALAAPVAAQQGLSCRGAPGGHLGTAAVCDRLSALLGARGAGVTLELTRDEPQVLAGRLVWQAGGRQVTGPLVDVTARDRALDARAADRLARGLLAVSDLP